MFFQFVIKKEQRDFLRFLWWDDFENEPVECRMNVHLFGTKSSLACLHFGLKQTASNNEAEFGSDTADFIRHNFYVDDGPTSVASVSEVINLINNTKSMCLHGVLRLHKFISNSKDVLAAIPSQDQAKGI